MDFDEVVAKRRSARDFTAEPISKDALMDIVRQAQRTPSWANSQPWKVYIATGEALTAIKRQHAELSSNEEPGASELPVRSRSEWGTGPQHNMAALMQDIQSYMGDDLPDFALAQRRLFNATALVYLTIPNQIIPWSLYDLGAFSQSLLLSAANKGIGSIPAYEIVKYPQVVRPIMGIPDEEALVAGIALGYPSQDRINNYISGRAAMDQILVIKE